MMDKCGFGEVDAISPIGDMGSARLEIISPQTNHFVHAKNRPAPSGRSRDRQPRPALYGDDAASRAG
jgi:hypothetical protein